MTRALWELRPDVRELADLTFGCLPGCGWCCTHPPEVAPEEERRLRARVPNVRVGFDGERSFLRLQGGCGACQFLSAERACTVYEDRPAHCRYFPFHVYFGRRVEVLVNRSCPGVVRRAGASARGEAESALAVADPALVARHAADAREVHETFRAQCEEAGAWGDADAAVREALAAGPALFARPALEHLAGADVRDLVAGALASFDAADPTRRPYLADPELRWLVFQRRASKVGVAELAVDGRLDLVRALRLEAWKDVEEDLAAALHAELAEMLARDCFAGSVFDRVDESGYAETVEEAAGAEVAAVAVDLALRARIVADLRPGGPAQVAAEARRFADSDFLDRPAIGAWL